MCKGGRTKFKRSMCNLVFVTLSASERNGVVYNAIWRRALIRSLVTQQFRGSIMSTTLTGNRSPLIGGDNGGPINVSQEDKEEKGRKYVLAFSPSFHCHCLFFHGIET